MKVRDNQLEVTVRSFRENEAFVILPKGFSLRYGTITLGLNWQSVGNEISVSNDSLLGETTTDLLVWVGNVKIV